MRKEEINGIVVPYDKSVEELETMIFTEDMSVFVVACEALSYKSEEKAFEILKTYSTHEDKYKRLCVLKTIFRHPKSEQEKDLLVRAILSDDIFFAENGLQIICEHKIGVPENVIISAVNKHFCKLHSTSLYVLEVLGTNEANFVKLIKWLEQSKESGQKEVLGEILTKKYLPERAEELFALFSTDIFAKIRVMAVEIGKEYKFDISKFRDDPDGHVRKTARNGE